MSRLRRNILYNLVGQLLTLVLGFAFTRYVYRGLGKEVLGIIYFATMLNSAMAVLLELGLGALVVKEVAASADTDADYTRRLVQTGATYFWVIYLFIALAQFLAAPWIAERWLNLETLPLEDGTNALRILGMGIFLAFPKSLYASVFRGLQRMGVTNAIDVSATIVQQAGVILLVLATQSIYAVVSWIALSYLLRVLAYQAALVRSFSWSILVPGYDREVVRRNSKFGLHLAGTMLLGTAMSQGDKFVISALLPLSYVGWYGFAVSTVNKGRILVGSVATAGFPRLSELSRSADLRALNDTFDKLQSLMCVLMAPVCAAIPFAVPVVFPMVLDAEATEALWLPSSLLAVGLYMTATINIPHFLALSLGRADIALRQNVYGVLLIFPTTVALIAHFELIGAAAGWCLYQALTYAYYMPRVYRECLQRSPRGFYSPVGRIFAIITMSYGVAFVLLWLGPGFGLVPAAAAYLTASVVYTAVVWRVADAGLRAEVRSLLGRLRRLP